MPKPKHLVDREITIWGDTWTVVNVGNVDGGKVYCHLASKTRVLQVQKNGRVIMRQACDWIDLSEFAE